MPCIFLVGGGSGGHIHPSIAVAKAIEKQADMKLVFVCSRNKLDAEILDATGYEYKRLWGGKIRRYLSPWILVEWIFMVMGFFQSFWLLFRHRPLAVFCKGGYVGVPMAFAAWLCRYPIIAHESDTVAGLANRIIDRLAGTVCTGFPITGSIKYRFTGNPVRTDLMNLGRQEYLKAYELTGFKESVPTVLVMGGSQGAQFLNETVEKILLQLVEEFQVIHITGIGKGIAFQHANYTQYSHVHDELAYLYSITDIAVSRAGAGSISELAYFHIPTIYIPLPSSAGDHQRKNAQFVVEKGGGVLLDQDAVNSEQLLEEIQKLQSDETRREGMKRALIEISDDEAAEKIAGVILDAAV